MKQTWLDIYFGKFKWYRENKKGTWYKHQLDFIKAILGGVDMVKLIDIQT